MVTERAFLTALDGSCRTPIAGEPRCWADVGVELLVPAEESNAATIEHVNVIIAHTYRIRASGHS